MKDEGGRMSQKKGLKSLRGGLIRFVSGSSFILPPSSFIPITRIIHSSTVRLWSLVARLAAWFGCCRRFLRAEGGGSRDGAMRALMGKWVSRGRARVKLRSPG
jgi:hypothetical protein